MRLQVLKCHIRHRCTFEIALVTEVGSRSVIGKVYLTDRADLFQSMEAVSRTPCICCFPRSSQASARST